MAVINLSHKFITKPGQLGGIYNSDDGIGITGDNYLIIKDSIIDLDFDFDGERDEAFAVTWGASALIERCVITGAAKLILIGSGDSDKYNIEKDKRVSFNQCIFEDFGRRGPEVQSGMRCDLRNCLIRNWADPSNFSVRCFGAWAHNGGSIYATNCIFHNTNRLSLSQSICDRIMHIGQAVNDSGLKALFQNRTYTAGWRRALTVGPKGLVSATNCYADKNLIIDNLKGSMSEDECEYLEGNLEFMSQRLYSELYVDTK